jgi:hypothetical protein
VDLLRGLFRVRPWELRHRRAVVRIRVALAIWLLFLTAVLCASGRWWGVFLLPPAALSIWLAGVLERAAET